MVASQFSPSESFEDSLPHHPSEGVLLSPELACESIVSEYVQESFWDYLTKSAAEDLNQVKETVVAAVDDISEAFLTFAAAFQCGGDLRELSREQLLSRVKEMEEGVKVMVEHSQEKEQKIEHLNSVIKSRDSEIKFLKFKCDQAVQKVVCLDKQMNKKVTDSQVNSQRKCVQESMKQIKHLQVQNQNLSIRKSSLSAELHDLKAKPMFDAQVSTADLLLIVEPEPELVSQSVQTDIGAVELPSKVFADQAHLEHQDSVLTRVTSDENISTAASSTNTQPTSPAISTATLTESPPASPAATTTPIVDRFTPHEASTASSPSNVAEPALTLTTEISTTISTERPNKRKKPTVFTKFFYMFRCFQQ